MPAGTLKVRAIPSDTSPSRLEGGVYFPGQKLSEDSVRPDIQPSVWHSRAMDIKEIIIFGHTADGRAFRPSNWNERLYYAVASYGPHGEVNFNPLVTMRFDGGKKAIVVDQRLQSEEPMIFEFLIGFGRDNELVMTDQDGNPFVGT